MVEVNGRPMDHRIFYFIFFCGGGGGGARDSPFKNDNFYKFFFITIIKEYTKRIPFREGDF
jgi:hypothetical protein